MMECTDPKCSKQGVGMVGWIQSCEYWETDSRVVLIENFASPVGIFVQLTLISPNAGSDVLGKENSDRRGVYSKDWMPFCRIGSPIWSRRSGQR